MGSSWAFGYCTGHFGHCTACPTSCHELDQRKSAADVIRRPLLVRWLLLSPDPRDLLVVSRAAARRVSLAVWSSVPLGSRLSAVSLSWAEVDSTPTIRVMTTSSPQHSAGQPTRPASLMASDAVAIWCAVHLQRCSIAPW